MSSRFHKTPEKVQRYTINIVNRALAEGQITQRDNYFIGIYVAERKAVSNSLGVDRIYKITTALVNLRRYLLLPYDEATINDLNAAISKIRDDDKYKQNSKSDFIGFVKRFFLWLIENNYSTIPEKKVQNIRVPTLDTMTKTCEMMLSPDEVKLVVEHCKNNRDRCFLMMLYEGAFRIGELGHLKWIQVSFPDDHAWAVTVNVNDKTGKPRLIPLVMTRPYLIQYMEETKTTRSPQDYVFTYKKGRQLQYQNMSKMIKIAATEAGIKKRVTPHLFRHSRISHLLSEGMGETITKQICWGNQSTKMLKTYAHISNETVMDAIAEKYGIVEKEEKKLVKVFEPQQCKRCLTVNTPTARYCSVCGIELSEEVKKQSDDLSNLITEFAKNHPDKVLKALASLE